MIYYHIIGYFFFKMTNNVINVTTAPVLLTAMHTHTKMVKR